MKLSQLKQKRPTTIPIDFGNGEPDTLTYDRAVISAEWTTTTSTRIGRLADLLVSWSITDDAGKPYQPADNLNGERAAAWAALLADFPPDVLKFIEDQIWDDYYAGKPLGGGSLGT